MSQTDLLHEPIEESQHDQPQPDPWLVDVMHKVQIPEAYEGREEVKPPPPRVRTAKLSGKRRGRLPHRDRHARPLIVIDTS